MSAAHAFVPVLVEHMGLWLRSAAEHPCPALVAMVLLYYCNERRNGGRVDLEALLTDPVAQAEARMMPTMLPVLECGGAGYWHVEGEQGHRVLVLDVYSVEHEERARATSDARRAAVAKRWGKRRLKSKGYTNVSTNVIQTDRQTCLSPTANTVGETDIIMPGQAVHGLGGQPGPSGQEEGGEVAPRASTPEEMEEGLAELRAALS